MVILMVLIFTLGFSQQGFKVLKVENDSAVIHQALSAGDEIVDYSTSVAWRITAYVVKGSMLRDISVKTPTASNVFAVNDIEELKSIPKIYTNIIVSNNKQNGTTYYWDKYSVESDNNNSIIKVGDRAIGRYKSINQFNNPPVFLKKYSSEGSSNDEFPDVDILEYEQAGFDTWTHIGTGTMNVYNPVNGVMLNVYMVATEHIGAPSEIYYRKSVDGGVTWSAQAPLPMGFDGSSNLNYIPGAMDYTSDGRLSFLYIRRNISNPRYDTYSIYSDDDGATWSSPVLCAVPPNTSIAIPTFTNNIIEFGNGVFGFPYFSGQTAPGESEKRYLGLFISENNCVTFSTYRQHATIEVPNGSWGELDIININESPNILIAMTRNGPGIHSPYQYISYNSGVDWTYQGQITFDTIVDPDGSDAMLPKFAIINIYGVRVVACYYTNRETDKVKRILALPENLTGINGNLGWNINTLTTLKTFTGVGNADGNGTACHPDGNYRGFFGCENETGHPNATEMFFNTPNDIDEMAIALGIPIKQIVTSKRLGYQVAPDFTPYKDGQLLYNPLDERTYIATDSDTSSDFKQIANLRKVTTSLITRWSGVEGLGWVDGTVLGLNNTFLGYNNGYSNTTGNDNTVLGYNSFYDNTTGDANTVIGSSSFDNNTTGSHNTILGYNSGVSLITGNANTIIGANITGLDSDLDSTIIIANGKGQQRIVVNSSGYIGLNDASPDAPFDVVGNSVFTSSGTGNALIINKDDGNPLFLFSQGTSDGQLYIRKDGNNNVLLRSSGTSYVYGGSLGIKTKTPSTELEVVGTTTTDNIILDNITVPSSPVAGQIYFDGTNFFGYNGSAWIQLDN